YLKPALSRANLTILCNAHVTRLTSSDSSEFVASGVQFLFNGSTHSVSTSGEVILSTGAITSPQLLELSGIGNAGILREMGIEVKVDLPAVGENAQEHIIATVSWELKDPDAWNTFDILRYPEVLDMELRKLKRGEGIFTLGDIGLHFAPLTLEAPDKAKDIMRCLPTDHHVPGLAEQYALQTKHLREGVAGLEILSFPGFMSKPNLPECGKKYISLVGVLNRPFSRGTIHIASPDVLRQPIIDPHYFEEDVDFFTFLEHIKFMRELGASEPLSSIVSKEINPGPVVQSDMMLATWLKNAMESTYHTIGTCSMLPRDKGGVVDAELRVYGTRNVRVVDLGIVPLHFTSHSQATVFAIAEQGTWSYGAVQMYSDGKQRRI
ncbi:GMC oxidoreductase-domain-containing protein, partial [Vararia minispora EC-137]